MPKKIKKSSISATKIGAETITNMIFVIRGQKVMLDSHLASLYGVETRRLNEQVRRNIERFPDDFMFQLTKLEFENLKSQFATSSWGGVRKAPLAFTEQGVAMLSSVLNSGRAIQVNIAIMRTFVQLKQMVSLHKDLANQLKKIEEKIGGHDNEIKAIIELIKRLHSEPDKTKKSIGFHVK